MEKKTNIVPEINAERINIVEPDGTPRRSLFNGDNIPPAIINGQDIAPGHRQGQDWAGLMFYNARGDECGGLIFNGDEDDKGNPNMAISLTFDQFQQDQVLQLMVGQQGSEQTYGVSLFDRPSEAITDTIEKMNKFSHTHDSEERQILGEELRTSNAQQAFLGKATDGSIQLVLNDSMGNRRFEIKIDEDDELSAVVIDSEGNESSLLG